VLEGLFVADALAVREMVAAVRPRSGDSLLGGAPAAPSASSNLRCGVFSTTLLTCADSTAKSHQLTMTAFAIC
jgi:hypothetical protein